MVRVERFGLVLRKKRHVDVVADRARALERFRPIEHTRQRRFARPVLADERDLVAPLDDEGAGAVEDADRAVRGVVGLGKGGEFQHRASRPARRGKPKRDLCLVFRRCRHPLHLFKLLDPALHLPRLGILVAKAFDEPLRLGDLPLLVEIGRLLEFAPLLAFIQIKSEVARVVGHPSVRQLGDGRDHAVEEIAVVRDEHDGAGITLEVAFEPVDADDVEVVGRFVEQEEVGSPQQELGESHAHAPAAGEGCQGAVEFVGFEAQPREHRLGFWADQVDFLRHEFGVDALQGVQQLLGACAAVVRPLVHLLGDAVFLLLEGQHRVEGGEGLVEDGPLRGHLLGILRQIADGAAPPHRPLVDRLEPGHHPQERRLACAVGSDQPDPLPRLDRPRQPVQNHLPAESQRYVVELNHKIWRSQILGKRFKF